MAAVVVLDGSKVQTDASVSALRVLRSMKPRPKKPRSIIVQMAGSGTDAVKKKPPWLSLYVPAPYGELPKASTVPR